MANMNYKRKNILRLSCAAALLLLPACTPTIAQRGNLLPEYKVEKIILGEHMRSDVLRTLGSPTTQSTFNPDIWYYIGQETEKRGILDAKVIEERIIMVKFNAETGIVETIEEIDEGRINIPISRDKTATHGNETGALKQLLGNLGKFNPKTE